MTACRRLIALVRLPGLASMRMLAHVMLLGMLWLAGPAARAVDPERTLAQLHHTAWTRSQGAPATVTSITQTPDGFLWLGSPSGLHRFDGVSFEQVRTLGGIDISAWGVASSLAIPGGGIWLSFGMRVGAGFYKDGRFTRYEAATGLGAAMEMAHDLDGNTWFVTSNGRLWRVPLQDGQPGAVQSIAADWNIDDDQIARRLAIDPQGTVWLSVRGVVPDPAGNLFYLPRGQKRFIRASAGVGNNLAMSADGVLWGTSGTSGLVAQPTAPLNSPIRTIAREPMGTLRFDRRGALWVQTSQGLAHVGRPALLANRPPTPTISDDRLTPAQGLSSGVIFSIFEDREGNIWLGTSAGIDRFRDSKLVRMTLPRRPNHMAVVPGDDGAVWAANWDAGLLKVTADGFRDFAEVPLSNTTLYRDPRGSVWVGNTQGLWKTEPGDQIVKVPSQVQVVSDTVRAMVADAEGGMWLAPTGGNGVWRQAGREWVRSQPADGFPERWLASTMLTDARGRTWMGHDDEILLVERGKARPMNAKALGLDVGELTTLYQRGGRVWVLGTRGLAAFDGERFRNLSHPGRRDFFKLTGIVETASGDLWLNASDALLHVPRSEVERGLAGASTPLAIERLGESDGFRGSTFPNAPMPSMAEASDGRIWVGTDAGLAWIAPGRLTRNTLAPQVTMRTVSFDGSPVDPALPFAPPPGPPGSTAAPSPPATPRTQPQVKQLEFAYTAASLTVPERVNFRYRLDGVDRDWQQAGTRRVAYYTNLDPGRYRFQVMAANEDGVWSKQAATYDFEVPPAWFQTWWFRVACVALAAVLLWLAHHLRSRQIANRARLRLELQQVERVRIARELHDTLLQSVTGLMLRFQAVSEGLPEDGAARQRMQSALARADKVLLEGRSRVTDLRHVSQQSLAIEHALAEEGRELAQDGDTTFEWTREGSSRELRPDVREELHKLMAEALTNAFRHACARTVRLHVSYGWRELLLRVSDDGVGMDDALLAKGRDGHWGLAGMRERAQALAARLTVTTSPGQGTTVELRLRGRRAYAD